MPGFSARLAIVSVIATTIMFGEMAKPSSAAPTKPAPKPAGKQGQAVNSQPRDKWAVLIGVTAPNSAEFGTTKNAAKNVMALARALKSPDGGRFAANHVVTLTDSQASTAEIQSTVLENFLAKKALPNDLIVLYVSGKVLPSSDHSDAVLCSFDTDPARPSATGVPLKKLISDLQTRTQSKQIICILDTSPADNKSSATDLTAADISKVKDFAEDCRVAVLSASELFQTSHDVAGTSAFCHYLIDGIETGAGQMPLSAVADYVVQNIRSDSERVKKPQQAIFLVNPAVQPLSNIAFGCATKVGSIKPDNIGYPISTLAQKRPDLLEKSKTPAKQDDDDDDDEGGANVDMRGYMAKMQRDIQLKWKAPKGVEQHRVLTVFTINRDGTITEPEIVEGSGSAEVDQSAIDALNAASPLDKLPPGSPKSVRVQYKFDWKVSHQ